MFSFFLLAWLRYLLVSDDGPNPTCEGIVLGQCGGFALFFMDEFQIDILFSNNRMIDVKAVISGINVYMAFVYGDPVLEKRDQVWERLTRFLPQLEIDFGS